MTIKSVDPYKFFRVATIVTLAFLAIWGLVQVVAQIKPYWADEWRLIYNLKFKSHAALWGPLEFTQQFPRVYLQLMKAITSRFDYSYLILRMPSYVVGSATILLAYRLMNKLYPAKNITRFLFVLIVISSLTFTEYFVQVKQYTMEMLLSLVAVWQLITLLDLSKEKGFRAGRYLLLCLSFVVVPYFSYTYPIAVAPVFIIMGWQYLGLMKQGKWGAIVLQWLPLLVGIGAISAFYYLDVSHLMGDKQMHNYWSYRMMGHSGVLHTAVKFWDFFAQAGTGLLFEIFFGVAGLSAFFYSLYQCGSKGLWHKDDENAPVRLYSILLIVLALGLFVAGKLPIEPKFNAFTLPSLAILIIYLLDQLKETARYRMVAIVMSFVFLLGLLGNVYSQSLRLVLAPDYGKRIHIYEITENAIVQAQAAKTPILVTPEVAYPDDIGVINPYMAPISAAAVLKTFPAYKVAEDLPVYSIPNMATVADTFKQLPPSVQDVLVCDGLRVRAVKR